MSLCSHEIIDWALVLPTETNRERKALGNSEFAQTLHAKISPTFVVAKSHNILLRQPQSQPHPQPHPTMALSANSTLLLPLSSCVSASSSLPSTAAAVSSSTWSSVSSAVVPSYNGDFFVPKKELNGGLSQAQALASYVVGSMLIPVADNPFASYRQLVQQYAKDARTGLPVHPRVAARQARAAFRAHPVQVAMSGVTPRIAGVGFKRVPKFGILVSLSYFLDEQQQQQQEQQQEQQHERGGYDSCCPGYLAGVAASVLSAPFINPIRYVERQQRAYFRELNGRAVPSVPRILKESARRGFEPLFRGTAAFTAHSTVSTLLGLVVQPRLQKRIQRNLNDRTNLGRSASSLVSSVLVSPIYVAMTNPLTRLEVIMQTGSITSAPVSYRSAFSDLARDASAFGLCGMFRGQGAGIAKAVVSLTLFHEFRHYTQAAFRRYNAENGYYS